MSRAVLISIRPKWCELIASGKKTVEVRKTAPHLKTPFKCYIYCTKDPGNKGSATHFFESDEGPFTSAGKTYAAFLSGTVIGEFVCDKVITDEKGENADVFEKSGCIPLAAQKEYSPKGVLYGWHISNLKIYNVPKKLSDLHSDCSQCGYVNARWTNCDFIIKRSPQSWCYVRCAP